MITTAEIESLIKEMISKETGIRLTDMSSQSSFHQLGLDSVNSLFLLGDLEDALNLDIDPLSLYDNPTIESFSAYINNLQNARI
ncbi:MAG: acyl carrier protein [Marinoscillum sp.]|uniref:acyl carrier protein n=1 Tax=Marinoscillum sp. TaxID=2024838 RepID=UPI003304423F